jgi:hypothetical protein
MPDDISVLSEICTVLKSPKYIFGNFAGCWLDENDCRLREPNVPTEGRHIGFPEQGTIVETLLCSVEKSPTLVV